MVVCLLVFCHDGLSYVGVCHDGLWLGWSFVTMVFCYDSGSSRRSLVTLVFCLDGLYYLGILSVLSFVLIAFATFTIFEKFFHVILVSRGFAMNVFSPS